jgi:hypothetical protein
MNIVFRWHLLNIFKFLKHIRVHLLSEVFFFPRRSFRSDRLCGGCLSRHWQSLWIFKGSCFLFLNHYWLRRVWMYTNWLGLRSKRNSDEHWGFQGACWLQGHELHVFPSSKDLFLNKSGVILINETVTDWVTRYDRNMQMLLYHLLILSLSILACGLSQMVLTLWNLAILIGMIDITSVWIDWKTHYPLISRQSLALAPWYYLLSSR